MKKNFYIFGALSCICFLAGCARCYQLDTLDPVATPLHVAITGHANQQPLVAVMSRDGEISTSGSASPGSWAAWKTVAGNMKTATAPVFVSEGNTSHLFARGNDNHLHHFTKVASGDWAEAPIQGPAQVVNGRISAAITNGNLPTLPKIIHLVFTAADNAVKYIRIQNGTVIHEQTWVGVLEATIGSDGAGLIMIGFRNERSVGFLYAHRGINWPLRFAGSFTFDPGWRSWDLSEVVWFAPRQLFSTIAVSAQPGTGTDRRFRASRVYHIRVLPVDAGPELNFNTASSVNPFPMLIERYGTRQRTPPKASLASYRNKLIAAWRSPAGPVKYARWDDADIQTPWIKEEGSRLCANSAFRPVIAPLKRTHFQQTAEQPNYGNDLFLAVSDRQVKAINFARAVLKTRMRSQLLLMQHDADTGCGRLTDVHQAYRINATTEERPYITELGFNLWFFPHEFIKGYYKKCANKICTGRLRGQPCSAAKMPTIVTRHMNANFCQGVFFNVLSPASNIFEELGHYMAIGMGWMNGGPGPTQEDANRCGIALSRLEEGFRLFNERTNICPQAPDRCPGFTGYGNNYDVTGREHSFIYATWFYFDRPSQLRAFIEEDLRTGDNLLLRKYTWIKTNIFKGVEFLQ